jgi:hypothetical protein
MRRGRRVLGGGCIARTPRRGRGCYKLLLAGFAADVRDDEDEDEDEEEESEEM